MVSVATIQGAVRGWYGAGRMIGLRPRSLSWILPHRLAIGERPGGFGTTHRRIRREEELAWLKKQGFVVVVSLLPGTNNLQAYDEAGLRSVHVPVTWDDVESRLEDVFGDLDQVALREEAKTYLHGDDVDDLLVGICGAYLLHLGLVENHPSAVATIEAATGRPLGPDGRAIVASVGVGDPGAR